jgi:hypothetical protein
MEEAMNRRSNITTYFVLCLLLCSLPGICAAAYMFPSGGYLSTQTVVSVKGSVNETVSIQVTKQSDGTIEKNQWISTYADPNPSSQSWSSQLSISAVDGGLGWSFQRTGLPVTWIQRTGLPATWKFPTTELPVWKKLPAI